MEHTLHALVRSTIIFDRVVNAEGYARSSRQLLVRMMGYLHEEMIIQGRSHKGRLHSLAFYNPSNTQANLNADDPDLPRLETAEDWIALSAFLCLITLLNVVSPDTYRTADQTEHLSITGSLEYLHEHADANELSIQQRRDFVWARGLVAQTLDVLSHIERAFTNTYPSNVQISPASLLHTSSSRKIFKQQLKWVLQGRSEAVKHHQSLLSNPPESLVMKFDKWQIPRQLRNNKLFSVKRRK